MRKTLQQLGIHDYFYYPRGKNNAITDVMDVKVGHTTVIEGDNIRTGVSVVIPPIDFRMDKLLAGGFAFNANGEMTGLQYVMEEARLISPIFLTNTFSVGDVYKAVVDYYQGDIALPIIGECWDGYLNDIVGRHVKSEHVYDAIRTASGGNIPQGNVGAGTGMTAFGFKAGIGTSSRTIKLNNREYTVGVLVNNNLGIEIGNHRYLRIGPVQINDKFLQTHPIIHDQSDSQQSSAIIIIATDIPMDHHQLNRLSKRAVLGMGRVGVISYSDSGEFILSFSTANKVPLRGTKGFWKIELIEESLLDTVFEATVEAVEESFINSILMAEDMTGKDGHEAKELPIDKLTITETNLQS
jgi:D-aminopeptidase